MLAFFESLFNKPKKPDDFRFTGIGTLLLIDNTELQLSSSNISTAEFAESVNRIFGLEHRVVEESGGFITNFVGDATIAVWRASAHPSHAELALACGRKLLAELKRTQTETVLSFQTRIAVATGEMTVDLIGGRLQVVGSTFATAKRLMDLELGNSTGSRLLCTSETGQCISGFHDSDSVATVRGCSGHEVPVFVFS